MMRGFNWDFSMTVGSSSDGLQAHYLPTYITSICYVSQKKKENQNQTISCLKVIYHQLSLSLSRSIKRKIIYLIQHKSRVKQLVEQ